MPEPSASQQVDQIISKHSEWKASILKQLRAIITTTDPNIAEEVKWKTPSRPEGLPVWTYNGIICFAEIWKDNVKLLFPNGSALNDQNGLFNARLNSQTIRAIEFREGDQINEPALQSLVQEAIKHNVDKKSK